MRLEPAHILSQPAEDQIGAIDRPGGSWRAIRARVRVGTIDASFCCRNLRCVTDDELARPKKILTRVTLVRISDWIIGRVDPANPGLRDAVLETEVLVSGQIRPGPARLVTKDLHPVLESSRPSDGSE